MQKHENTEHVCFGIHTIIRILNSKKIIAMSNNNNNNRNIQIIVKAHEPTWAQGLLLLHVANQYETRTFIYVFQGLQESPLPTQIQKRSIYHCFSNGLEAWESLKYAANIQTI